MKILFISHEATATGAPRLLMEIQRWLKANTSVEFATVFVRGGVLLQEFESVGQVIGVIHPAAQHSIASRVVAKVRRLVSSSTDRLVRKARSAGPFDLVYCNSIASASSTSHFRACAPLVATHIHELPALIQAFGPQAIESALFNSDHFLAASTAVRTGLVEVFGADPSHISVMNGFISPDFGQGVDPLKAAFKLRAHLNIPTESLVVGVCGTGALHKGHDLLPQVLSNLPATILGREVHLVHVGASPSASDLALLKRDAEIFGVASRLHYAGRRTDVAEWTAGFDVLAFPSREDAFGLVLLEAAKFGIPTVCFDQGGGAPEFCEGGAGVTVPYLCAASMARAIAELLGNEQARMAMGGVARAKLLTHYQVDSAIPRWMGLLNGLLRRQGAAV